MSRRLYHKYYSPGPANIFSGGNLVGKNFQMILDSGSSYTYFTSQLYGALLLMVQKDLSGKPLNVAPEEHALPRCWKGTKPFKSVADVRSYFKPLALTFGQGKRATQLDIPPEGYLIVAKSGNVCLGILNGTEAGLHDFNIIGDISVQDLAVIYDNEKEQIGWARANCNIRPKFATASLR
ncbi:hypothetical protein Taro_046532 [Colocasia esculenta]|uniref:Peptidase A1 domain-containing protein n=1 Tax=Colocasia esculenta TaxID=4460 RepID=A0A843WZD5_COLES|nr:hypothetical protein [Colocasia esculenta]